MKMWLVGLGLALLYTVNAESECDHSLMAGKWYFSGASSNCKHHLKHKDHMKVVPAEISVTEDNKLKFTSHFPKKDGCHKFAMDFEKLDDGTYYHVSDWGEKKIEILSTDCENYIIGVVKIQKKGKEKTSTLLMLYTKVPEAPLELKEKFLERSDSLGFARDQVVFPQEVACENNQ